MKAYQKGTIVVLEFDDTHEARTHGKNLSEMKDGNRYYAVAPEGTPENVVSATITSIRSKSLREKLQEFSNNTKGAAQ